MPIKLKASRQVNEQTTHRGEGLEFKSNEEKEDAVGEGRADFRSSVQDGAEAQYERYKVEEEKENK